MLWKSENKKKHKIKFFWVEKHSKLFPYQRGGGGGEPFFSFFLLLSFYKVVELVNEGSVINGASPSSVLMDTVYFETIIWQAQLLLLWDSFCPGPSVFYPIHTLQRGLHTTTCSCQSHTAGTSLCPDIENVMSYKHASVDFSGLG